MAQLKKVTPAVEIAEQSKEVNLKIDESAARAAKALGLTVQARRHRMGAAIPELFAHARLSPDELLVWRRFCQTRYYGNDFARYAFDTIPSEALVHWREIAKHPWDRFEIWTTERRNDPLLVGRYGNEHYMLARWGEESPGLLPFSKVLDEVLEEAWKAEEDVPTRILVSGIVGCLAGMLAVILPAPGNWLIGIMAAVAFWLAYPRVSRRVFEKSELALAARRLQGKLAVMHQAA